MTLYNSKICKEAVKKAEGAWKNTDLDFAQFDLAKPQPIDFQAIKFADFSWKLWRKSEQEDGFLTSRVISPTPLIFCLANLQFIADEDTRKELTDLLGLPTDENMQLKTHEWILYAYNRLCQQSRPSRVFPVHKVLIRGYTPGQMDLQLRNVYDRYAVDMKCLHSQPFFDTIDQELDHWVSKASLSKLTKMLPEGSSFDKTANLAIMTSLHFEGEWMNLPTQNFAKLCNYTVENMAGEVKTFKIPCIKTWVRADYGEFEECTVCGYEYKWSSLTIYFFKPRGCTLAQMEASLSGNCILEYIRFMCRRRFYKESYVDTQIPLFAVESHHDFAPVLQKMGLKYLFDSGMCNLFKFCPKQNKTYSLSAVHQHMAIKVGLKSADLRHLVKEPKQTIKNLPPKQKVFELDGPFLFILYEFNTGLILSIGRVVDPSTAYTGAELPRPTYG